MSLYIVDTNFFIQAHRVNYPLDIALSFWLKIKELADSGSIISIDKVKDELWKNTDELKVWCEEYLPEGFFQDSSGLISEYMQVIAWANSKNTHYTVGALEEFLQADEADAWIVAAAKKLRCNITTHEISQPNRKNKIKIPEPCHVFDLHYVNTMEMFRELKLQF